MTSARIVVSLVPRGMDALESALQERSPGALKKFWDIEADFYI